MVLQEIIYRCTICGYTTKSVIEVCPACNDGDGNKWESPNLWPYGRVSAADSSNPPPQSVLTLKGNTQ